MIQGNIDFYLIFDMFLLLLIGMGPKIALVPFLELTQGMDAETQKQIANRMVRTAVSTALLLVILGWFLMRLLHFTPGAANVAGGIVLLLLALHMLVSPSKTDHTEKASDRTPMQMAVYPLSVTEARKEATGCPLLRSSRLSRISRYRNSIERTRQSRPTSGSSGK